MSSVDIIVPNLVPGKRYRMVVETANSAGQINVGSTSVPSIEFVVPSANQLLSSYIPKYSVTTVDHKQTGGEITGYNPIYGVDPDPYWTDTTTAKTKKCDDTPTIRAKNLSWANWYVFRFDSLSGVPPVGQTFYVSGMGKTSTSWYYDFLQYKCEAHTSNNNIVATAIIVNENSWRRPPNGTSTTEQSSTTRRRWRDQGGKPFVGIESEAAVPTLSWKETGGYWTDNVAPILRYEPIYSTIVPGYSVSDVTVFIPTSLKLENRTDGTSRVVELPVFFYIKNGRFYNLDDTEMTGYPPAITSIPSTIPVSGTNLKANSDISSRSYRFTTARYTSINNGLWSAEWSQTDDAYGSEPLMTNVVYSQQAVL